jgi:hypothetical protein
MGDDEPHASTCFVVATARLITGYAEHIKARRRLVQYGMQAVRQALHPLPVKARFEKFIIAKEITSGDRNPDLRKVVAGRRRVELDVFVAIKFLVSRVHAVHVGDGRGFVGNVRGMERCRRAADEPGGLGRAP